MLVALRGLWLVLCVAEGAGLEPAHRFPDDGLASRCLNLSANLPWLWRSLKESNPHLSPGGREFKPRLCPARQAPNWHTPRDSNPDQRFWRPPCCRYTRGTCGCPGRHRTYAHRLNRAALYRLSYRTKIFRGMMVGVEGFEPSRLLVNGFTVRRASPSAPHPHERGCQYDEDVVLRQEFELVWVTGIEPAASRSQSACSTF